MTTQIRDQSIITLRKAGLGPRDIAKTLNISKGVVSGVLFRAGLTSPHKKKEYPITSTTHRKRGRPRIDPAKRGAVLATYLSGVSIRRAAAKWGVSVSSIQNWLRDGVPVLAAAKIAAMDIADRRKREAQKRLQAELDRRAWMRLEALASLSRAMGGAPMRHVEMMRMRVSGATQTQVAGAFNVSLQRINQLEQKYIGRGLIVLDGRRRQIDPTEVREVA